MPRFKVKMVELQRDGSTRELTQIACVSKRQDVIDIYGLNEPDIVSYTIEEES